jgi:hypothetical protein
MVVMLMLCMQEREIAYPRAPTTREKEQLAASKTYRQALKSSAFYLRPPPPPKGEVTTQL